ncbi:MAG: Fic family protein [Rhodothermia bacterium]|nr:MAG: Fic family protein [Rhodothermia bacterium]
MNSFHGRLLPEPARPVGYAALIDTYNLSVPFPLRLAAIAERHHPVPTSDWLLLTPRHDPGDTLLGNMEFALKREGVRLDVLTQLFQSVSKAQIASVLRQKPTGIYTRRLWFLYEWLTREELDLPDARKVKSVMALNPHQQFSIESGELSLRQRVINNLPGTPDFCPLVWRTALLTEFMAEHLDARARKVIGHTHPDVLSRAAAFLLLGDSQATFRIEGERPPQQRAQRWGNAIGEAGAISLTIAELERLQHIVIGDHRFVKLGLRNSGGFVGTYDRNSREPIPEHISARPKDLTRLLEGLIECATRSLAGGIDPVVTAACTAFGFVFMHPFEDGNGRIHRWLVHHVLAKAGYNPTGIVFPISAAILRQIEDYKDVLGAYSRPLLPLINWRPTDKNNVEVLNETSSYYAFFDATRQAEFLFKCVKETVEHDLPSEVSFLEAFDQFGDLIQEIVDMSQSTVDLLHRFLKQGQGRLSARAREKEFKELSSDEIAQIEKIYKRLFLATR